MLYVMSDFHLSTNTNKPMDKFGPEWKDHADQIREYWPLTESDIIIMPGDFSWALRFEEVVSDLEWLHSLPGKKILSKGNHDTWWATAKKLKAYEEQFPSIRFLHNESIQIDDISICVAKGYNVDLETEEAAKLINRESIRLDLSLSKAKTDKKIVFMHYPPLTPTHMNSIFSEIMEKHGVSKCYYGHLHGKAQAAKIEGSIREIEYKLVSSDSLKFKPIKVEI